MYPGLPFFRTETLAANRLAHLGIIGPTLEMFHRFFLRLLPVAFEPLLLHFQPRGTMITPPQRHHIVAKFAQNLQVGLTIVVLSCQLSDGRLALVAVNQILPYGRVIRSRMKPAADELTGVLSWTCKRVGVF